jgi:hypothetical protein
MYIQLVDTAPNSSCIVFFNACDISKLHCLLLLAFGCCTHVVSVKQDVHCNTAKPVTVYILNLNEKTSFSQL